MKIQIFIFSCIVFLFSCSSDSQSVNLSKNDKYFRIVGFKVLNDSIDLNNDSHLSSDIFSEFGHYFDENYDLEIKSIPIESSFLFSIYLPTQNIYYDYLCCPTGYVEFSREGFTIKLKSNDFVIENYVIDISNKIIRFSKVSENGYMMLIEKKYFDFKSSKYVLRTYCIEYLEMN